MRTILAITVCLSLLVVGCSDTPRDAEIPPEPTIHPIFERSEDELQKAACKISWMGDQKKPVPNVVFATKGYQPSGKLFIDAQKGVVHNNDQPGFSDIHFAVTPAEFKRVLAALHPIARRRPDSPFRGDTPPAIISCTLLRETGHDREAFEIFVLQDTGVEFYQTTIEALDRANQLGRERIEWQASCGLGSYWPGQMKK